MVLHVTPPPPGWDPATDPGTGSEADPFHSVATAVREADGGDDVRLGPGRYVENVLLDNVRGDPAHKIVVQPHDGAVVSIDGLETRFRDQDGAWEPVVDGAPDEFRWNREFTDGEKVRRGAFLETPFLPVPRHTRLVTYDRDGDFRAPGGRWPKDLTTGDNNVWRKRDDPPGWTHTGIRNWVYMGPGLWFDEETRRLHIRLSPTRNGVPDLADYTGPTDPAQVGLALSLEDTFTLRMTRCSDIVFRNLTLRFGGQDTIRIGQSHDIAFEHVRIHAGSRAIRLQEPPNERIRFSHCEIDGGLPPWFFRSDRKDGYRYTPHDPDLPTQPEPVVDPPVNGLGENTTGVLVSGGPGCSDVVVEYCEISHGHDVYVFGNGARFHHNWVHDINDDALNFGGEATDTDDARVYGNVITRCLTALSFGAQTRAKHVRIFRNLVDLREPTASIRPAADGADPFRTGVFVKLNGPGEGPIDLWHNTCVVLNPGAGVDDPEQDDLTAVGFGHYRALLPTREGEDWVTDPRRSFNNVFVAVYPDPGRMKPIAFLPPSSFAGLTDGNVYTRLDPGSTTDRYLVVGQGGYRDLDGADGYRADSPPHEASGRQLAAPSFVSFAADGHPDPGDDLRPRLGSPRAIAMPEEIGQIDRSVGGSPGGFLDVLFGRPRGCYRRRWEQLAVGVGGQTLFPG